VIVPKTKIAPLTEDEVKAILNVALPKRRDYLILRLFVKTGARLGELDRFSTKDINFRESVIYIPIAKRDERREVPIDLLSAQMLRSYISDYKITGRLWDISYRNIRDLPGKYAGFAGVSKRVSAHSFRHFFATSLIRGGVNVFAVKTLLGHKSIGTTDHYTHIATSEVMGDYQTIMGRW
jgi:integrase/recombinase XerD